MSFTLSFDVWFTKRIKQKHVYFSKQNGRALVWDFAVGAT